MKRHMIFLTLAFADVSLGGVGKSDVLPNQKAEVSGGLTGPEITAVVRANLNQIRHCYEQLLKKDPNASGKIKVNFTVNAKGFVENLKTMESNFVIPTFISCVEGKIGRWRFPPPRNGVAAVVSYPFTFKPN